MILGGINGFIFRVAIRKLSKVIALIIGILVFMAEILGLALLFWRSETVSVFSRLISELNIDQTVGYVLGIMIKQQPLIGSFIVGAIIGLIVATKYS